MEIKKPTEAYNELVKVLKERLNNECSQGLNDLMPEYGKHLGSDYFDCDTGRQQISYFDRSEEEALQEAQYEMLLGLDESYFEKFVEQYDIQDKVQEFVYALCCNLCKEALKC